MKLFFHGGAKSVTGANYLLEHNNRKLLVDCGLLQGSKYAETFNYDKFPYNPSEIDALVITHSHIDHIGRIPKLFKDGFRGKIIITNPAIDLAKEALPNSTGLLSDEARRNGHEPIFRIADTRGAIALMEGHPYEQDIHLGDDLVVRLHDAGHILGSSIIEIRWKNKDSDDRKIYFSGDLGNPPTPLLNNPFFPGDGDYVVVESTYGSRVHEDRDKRKGMLEDIIEETAKKGGTIMIPSFAMERTQEILFELNLLLKFGRIPNIPVFLDSPLAIKLTKVYKKYREDLNHDAITYLRKWGGIFDFDGLHLTMTPDESKAINNVKGPKIIIAGSGMSIGGRILHHEKRYLSDPNSSIVFMGYQVKGSLGRRILEKEKEVKILGDIIRVKCTIKAIGGYSAHADQPLLLKWIKGIDKGKSLKKVFVVQGEEDSSIALANKIKDTLVVDAVVPSLGDSVELI
jgi:metallo-beta-lactamase family protein